ncbi:MAG TPA: lysophospholipid acyltransferase family protein [Dongiaceae bacterium]|nr:lysophospholipid acyltransferase family protein [Dongiaceae bacterium]
MSGAGAERRPTIGHFVAYLLGRAVFGVLALLPLGAARGCGRGLGRLFWWISARHRRIARGNLTIAFAGALGARERDRIARASFAHLGAIVGDATHFREHLRRPTGELAVYEGLEHLEAARAAGRGILVFSGHFGHWEMVALLQHRLGVPMTMVVAPLENRLWDRFITRLRAAPGNAVLSKRKAARPILRTLREGGAIAILIDQNVRGDAGIFVDFFGLAASTTPALATLAYRSGAVILPVFSWFRDDGRLQIAYRAPLAAVRRGAIEDDVRALTRACTALLEAEVRERPAMWLWMHDRWRTRPHPATPAAPRAPERAPGTGLGAPPAPPTSFATGLRR